MSEPVDDTTPRRFRRLPHGGPLRLLMPWICVIVGVAMAVKGAIDLQVRGDGLFVVLGAGLVIVGVVAFFVYRWLEKRGL